MESLKRLSKKKFSVEEAINVCLYAIIFFLPFIVAPFGSDTYYLPKAIFLWLISGVILMLFIMNRDYKLDLTCKIVVVFVGIILISTLNSLNIKESILGGKFRWEGAITFICYGIIFIAANKYSKLKKKYIDVFLVLGLVMSVYGIFQVYGYDSLPRDSAHTQSMRCYGLIGHGNFFSTYLLILLGISISRFIFWDDKKCYVYSLFYVAALIGTQTRGGWMSLGIFCLAGLFFIIKDFEKIKKAILLVFSFIIIFFAMDYSKGEELKARFQTIIEDVTNVTDYSGSSRIAIYRASLTTICKYPLLGTGPAALWNSFEKDLPKDSGYFWQRRRGVLGSPIRKVDKVHNELLNYAATSGIPSMIIYLVMIGMVFTKIINNIRDDKFKVIFIVLFGYVVQANFNISVISVAPLFWIILGIGSNSEIIKKID
tara:strand:- start:274 stop:1557 length:1284 start_codon:yes stop_codon:yes gene_type:complete